ncbi:MAG: hypothetical protein JOZ38_05950 [Candidatus Eremiobacteraeota bacterium]|nr:hypothetical protein [Candidatus Eremiobacteraeota bacterium]
MSWFLWAGIAAGVVAALSGTIAAGLAALSTMKRLQRVGEDPVLRRVVDGAAALPRLRASLDQLSAQASKIGGAIAAIEGGASSWRASSVPGRVTQIRAVLRELEAVLR